MRKKRDLDHNTIPTLAFFLCGKPFALCESFSRVILFHLDEKSRIAKFMVAHLLKIEHSLIGTLGLLNCKNLMT